MVNNRSVPPCAVIPVLHYPSPKDAATWLEAAFGFTVRLRIENHRIQMRAGEGCFTIAEGSVKPNHSCSVQVQIEGAKEHCARVGHSSPVMTLGVYAHVSDGGGKHMSEAVERLSARGR